MKIAVIGTGYVGLVAGACFADTGNSVVCVDKDRSKIDRLNKGEIPIYEPGLEGLVKRGMTEGRLRFTTSTREAIEASEIVFLAVGTPSTPSGAPDMTYVRAAAREIGEAMPGYRLIVNKSTVPIGTHRSVAEWIKEHTKHDFDVVSNPEFLKEGTAVTDFLKPDRVVIGTEKEEIYERMADLYAPFVRQGNPILWMDPVSAEITKYACNAFLATRISFMNELSHLCEKTGADVESIRKGMSTDVRIGKHFLYAGVGYGGSCFPKDVKALVDSARNLEVRLGIVEAAQTANDRQKSHIAYRIREELGQELKGKTFALWGLAFKPNTDDMREAPALRVIEELHSAGARVRAYDPIAMANAKSHLGDKVEMCSSRDETLTGADALIILTEWNEFRQPDFGLIRDRLRKPVIFDGRNIFSPKEMKRAGFRYISIGRPVA